MVAEEVQNHVTRLLMQHLRWLLLEERRNTNVLTADREREGKLDGEAANEAGTRSRLFLSGWLSRSLLSAATPRICFTFTSSCSTRFAAFLPVSFSSSSCPCVV